VFFAVFAMAYHVHWKTRSFDSPIRAVEYSIWGAQRHQFLSLKTYRPSVGVKAMVRMNGGVNVMESGDAQWRVVLMIQAKVQVVVAT
jgi:hypothetical protein